MPIQMVGRHVGHHADFRFDGGRPFELKAAYFADDDIGLIAWLRADMKTDRAEAARDRRAFQQSMDGFRVEMRTFQTEMQRLAERQSHLEGARTAAGD